MTQNIQIIQLVSISFINSSSLFYVLTFFVYLVYSFILFLQTLGLSHVLTLFLLVRSRQNSKFSNTQGSGDKLFIIAASTKLFSQCFISVVGDFDSGILLNQVFIVINVKHMNGAYT